MEQHPTAAKSATCALVPNMTKGRFRKRELAIKGQKLAQRTNFVFLFSSLKQACLNDIYNDD